MRRAAVRLFEIAPWPAAVEPGTDSVEPERAGPQDCALGRPHARQEGACACLWQPWHADDTLAFLDKGGERARHGPPHLRKSITESRGTLEPRDEWDFVAVRSPYRLDRAQLDDPRDGGRLPVNHPEQTGQ